MSDQELLELAAKAAGLPLGYGEGEYFYCEHGPFGASMYGKQGNAPLNWNPLADDGDAHRLAVALQLTVCNEHLSAGIVYCTRGDTVFDGVWSGTSADVAVEPQDYAATRRAIVRAAAELGKAKP